MKCQRGESVFLMQRIIFVSLYRTKESMKIDFADNQKEPTLKSLHLIMREVAEDAKNEQLSSLKIMQEAIQLHLAALKRKYKLKE